MRGLFLKKSAKNKASARGNIIIPLTKTFVKGFFKFFSILANYCKSHGGEAAALKSSPAFQGGRSPEGRALWSRPAGRETPLPATRARKALKELRKRVN